MQLEDIIAKLDEEIRQQQMKRVQQSLNISENNPVNR
jgi:hypothetical protein